jgi:hypothetical protein
MGAVGSWSLLAGRHGLPILLIALVSGTDSDAALPALLVDVSVPGFGRIGLKIGTVFHIRCRDRPFVGAAGGGHWRQILFRHVVVSVFALFDQNSAAVCLVPFAAGQESRAATSAAAAAVKVSLRITGQTMRSCARYLDRSSPLGSAAASAAAPGSRDVRGPPSRNGVRPLSSSVPNGAAPAPCRECGRSRLRL